MEVRTRLGKVRPKPAKGDQKRKKTDRKERKETGGP